MSSLQHLHDFYLTTKPNARKVQTASQLLIRLCKQLNLDSPADIDDTYYPELCAIIDSYYENDYHKAIQDKSILAEMIGRYGPKDGYEIIMESLLEDRDQNLRQFCMQTLEYSAQRDFERVTSYLEHYKNSDDKVMQAVAARLVSKVFRENNEAVIREKIEQWLAEGDISFLLEIKKSFSNYIRRQEDFANSTRYRQFYDWLNQLLLKNN